MLFTINMAQDEIKRARNKSAGRKLANNTRLYEHTDGSFGITLHGTEVVTVNTDGTWTLRSGGWQTPTTLDRIRRYSPVNWKLFSERGEWFMRLAPNPNDPHPERVEREIPKPYDATDPGDEPVKSTEGCVAGQTVATEHVGELVEIYRREMREHDVIQGDVVSKGFSDDGRYDRVNVKRTWTDHVYIGQKSEQHGWDEGWANLPDNRSGHSRQFVNEDGEKVTYVQCVHCKEFDAEHETWRYRMYGDRWGRKFDQQTGYATYAAMMERFHNDKDLWQQAYIEDFRARREYLKAAREWDERNRIPFYDGVVIDSEGYTPRLREKGPSPAKLRRHEAAVAKLKKRIDKYVDGFIAELKKGTMPMPSEGDCWYCSMFNATPPNTDATRLYKRGTTVEPGDTMGNEHLLSHMEERYYVPSLAVNALRERGYKDIGVAVWLDMDMDAKTMGKPRGHYDSVRRDIRRYLSKRLIPQAPTS
jgi:hypothetical protein